MFELEYVIGRSVGAVDFGSGVTLDLWRDVEGKPADLAKLEAGRVRYEPSGGPATELGAMVDDATRYAPLLAIYRSTVTAARVHEDTNTLELEFENGDRLTALPMENVEGWQLAGPGTRLVVAVPGGNVAVWD
jgi:hypothetical protein